MNLWLLHRSRSHRSVCAEASVKQAEGFSPMLSFTQAHTRVHIHTHTLMCLLCSQTACMQGDSEPLVPQQPSTAMEEDTDHDVGAAAKVGWSVCKRLHACTLRGSLCVGLLLQLSCKGPHSPMLPCMYARAHTHTHTHTHAHTQLPDLLTQRDELHQQQGKAMLEKGYTADDESGQAARHNKVRCSFPTAASLYVIAMNVQPQTYLCL